ncbi:MAG: hypothetical protein A2156_12325 [Deltaproteobacteria bacterium RBG_16_48_10]|nr:MAG: hypothetical protein A2156_12325 [Deltaproteobacteria bacterium RBG_16_48_10]
MKKMLTMIMLLGFLFGCAWIPVRPALQENINVSPGKIEGNQFTGIRYSFKVSAPPHWKITTEFPDFLEKLGYDRPFSTDKEQTELYAYNPETKSTITFDFTPTGRYARFNQKKIELLTSMATESLKAELDKEFGKGVVKPDVFPAEPISLKGVQYAAKKYATYAARGMKQEQGWIYGFTEPYQIFIIYSIFERAGANDRQDLKKILDSFEFITKK